MASFSSFLRASLDRLLRRSPGFQQSSRDAAQAIHAFTLRRGESARGVADLLHGKWIGHPLHPILTDLTIGSWILGTLFDFVGLLTFSRSTRKTADQLVTLGTITAVPTALSGMADYSGIEAEAAGHGALHGMVNALAFFLYFRSVRARFGNHYGRAMLYSTLGLGCATLASWLGGELVFRHQMGVDQAEGEMIADWTPVLAASDLIDGEPQRVEVNEDVPVLLYREGAAIYAIGAVCSHAGGPLEEGTFADGCVECPWHNSVFDLRDGHVVHGPATFDEPPYQVRVQDGQIEIRSWALDLDAAVVLLDETSPHHRGQGVPQADSKQDPVARSD